MHEFKHFLQNTEVNLINMYLHTNMTITEIAEKGEISKTKFYRILEKNGLVLNMFNNSSSKIFKKIQSQHKKKFYKRLIW